MGEIRLTSLNGPYGVLVSRSSSRRGAVLLTVVVLMALAGTLGWRAWWSAGEAADRASWVQVQQQTEWLTEHMAATRGETVEPCARSLKLGAITWNAPKAVPQANLDEARARLQRDGWSVRSTDVTDVVLTKEYDGRVAEIDLVRPAGFEDTHVTGSLTLPAKFCGT